MTTWREEIKYKLKQNEERWEDIVSCTLSEEELDIKFYDGYGGTEGLPFTVWTNNFVYFPICYDGSEWCGCVARNPNGKPTEHQGGG